MTPRLALAAVLTLLIVGDPVAQTSPSATDVQPNIQNLGSLDFSARTNAARLVRRAPAPQAVPALTEAVRRHPDGFVRYRALVLLTSFNDRETGDLMRELVLERNDRLREVAYKWMERHPDPRMTTTLLGVLRTETAEFVRPALVSALAALGSDPQVQRAMLLEVTRGLDFFRSAVIDALGRHQALYAVDAIAGVAKLDGPLQDDAVLALGRIGGPRATATLAEIKGPAPTMLRVRAAQCLRGQNCDAHVKALADSAAAANVRADIVSGAVASLSAVAEAGNANATAALVELGGRQGFVRDQAAVGLAAAALRRPEDVLGWIDAAPEAGRQSAIELLKEGFDALEEDFAEEQFFAAVRASYWKAGEGSSGRTLAADLIQKLEF